MRLNLLIFGILALSLPTESVLARPYCFTNDRPLIEIYAGKIVPGTQRYEYFDIFNKTSRELQVTVQMIAGKASGAISPYSVSRWNGIIRMVSVQCRYAK